MNLDIKYIEYDKLYQKFSIEEFKKYDLNFALYEVSYLSPIEYLLKFSSKDNIIYALPVAVLPEYFLIYKKMVCRLSDIIKYDEKYYHCKLNMDKEFLMDYPFENNEQFEFKVIDLKEQLNKIIQFYPEELNK